MRRPGARRIFAGAEWDFAGDGAEQRGFAGAVGAGEAELQAVGQRDADAAEDFAIAESDGGVLNFDEPFGLAAGGVKGDAGRGGSRAGFGIAQLGDQGVGVVNAGFGFGGAGLGAAAQPFHLYRARGCAGSPGRAAATPRRPLGLQEIWNSCLLRAAGRRSRCG